MNLNLEVNIRQGKAQPKDSYAAVLDELMVLTENKRAGYSPGDDPFKNFRMSEMFSVDPVRGILVRVMDKMARVASLLDNPQNEKVGESLRDTMMDAGNYMLIAVAYMDQERAEVRAMVDRLVGDDIVLYPSVADLPSVSEYLQSLDGSTVFDSSDMDDPDDGDLIFKTDSEGYVTSIEGGPLEEPVNVAPDPCCEDDCEDCDESCKDECNPDCSNHKPTLFPTEPILHNSEACPVCIRWPELRP